MQYPAWIHDACFLLGLVEGSSVKIIGMKGRQDLNGEFATIECLLDEHIQLKLSSNDIVCVKYANVVKADHMETQVAQMNKDYFFGNDGTILGEKRSLEQYCAVMNRYMVRLLDSSVKGTCTQDITDQMQQDAQMSMEMCEQLIVDWQSMVKKMCVNRENIQAACSGMAAPSVTSTDAPKKRRRPNGKTMKKQKLTREQFRRL